jgi:hypothetical protein
MSILGDRLNPLICINCILWVFFAIKSNQANYIFLFYIQKINTNNQYCNAKTYLILSEFQFFSPYHYENFELITELIKKLKSTEQKFFYEPNIYLVLSI